MPISEMDFIFTEARLCQGANYLVRYVERAFRIKTGDRSSVRALRIAYVLFAIECAHLIFISIYDYNPGPFGNFLQINLVRLIWPQSLSPSNLLAIPPIIFSAYELYLAYMIHPHGPYFPLYYDIFIRNKRASLFDTNQSYANVNHHIRRCVRLFHQFCAPFVVIINLLILMTQLYAVYIVFTGCLRWWSFVAMEARWSLSYLTLYTFAHAQIICAMVLITCIEITRIRLKQFCLPPTRAQLRNLNHYLRRFRMDYIRTLKLIPWYNRSLGMGFTVFILIHCPITSLVMGLLFLNQIPVQMVIFMLSIVMFELTCTLGFHLLTANGNAYIQPPLKHFIHYSLLIKYSSVLYKLQKTAFIEAFYTKNPYGFSYTTIGLVSMFTYLKYLLLSVELQMYALTWLKNK